MVSADERPIVNAGVVVTVGTRSTVGLVIGVTVSSIEVRAPVGFASVELDLDSTVDPVEL